MPYSKEVMTGLDKIFKNRFSMNIDFTSNEVMAAQLLGSQMKMSPSDLLYLFFDIEDVFGIRISEDAIISYDFSTLNGIVCTIIRQLEENSLSLTGS